MKEIDDELYELINKTTNELLKLRIASPFCSICGKPIQELFVYTLPAGGHYWARWVCYECYEQLEVGYDCGRRSVKLIEVAN